MNSAKLHWIWLQAYNQLEIFERRVKEGRSLDEASDFARWLMFSGIIGLLSESPQDAPLKVDGPLLQWKCEELFRSVTHRYSTGDMDPHLSQKEMKSLHDKLDLIAGYLGQMNSPRPENASQFPSNHEIVKLFEQKASQA